jgi:hypothetical protein
MWHGSEEGECREADETDEAAHGSEHAQNPHQNNENEQACTFTENKPEPVDAMVKANIECVEIDQCEVHSGCVRTLMMQTGVYADKKRFDVIEQTATPDGFQHVSTVFSDLQKAVDHLRDAKNSTAAKPKRKYNEIESKNADCHTHKASRVSFKRCSISIMRRALRIYA